MNALNRTDSSVAKTYVFPPKRIKRARIWELDFLRGICILLMVADHLMFTIARYFAPVWIMGAEKGGSLANFCIFSAEYWGSDFRSVAHPVVIAVFFIISGICCTFSRGNLKRGLKLAVVSIVFSAVTYVLEFEYNFSGAFVHFGVLALFSLCILLWEGIRRLFRNKYLVCAVCFAVFLTITLLYHLYTVPADTPYVLKALFWRTMHADPSTRFYSPGDFFPLVPYGAYFFFGGFIGPLLYSKKRSLLPSLNKGWQRPFSFCGRHSLLIYLLHALIVAAVLMLISYFAITPGNWVMV